ncbi:MAG: hypothetical protein ACTSVZ_05110 [Promethearchaeota archaeon]
MEKSNNKYIKKFSIFEIRAAKLTVDQLKKNNLLLDRRRKTLNPKNVEYLKQLGLPEQYTGPAPKAKVHVKAPKKGKPAPSKPSPSKAKAKPKPKPKKEKPVSKPAKAAKKKVVEKKKVEKKTAEKKPAEKKKVEGKTAETKPIEKKKVEKKTAEKKSVEKKEEAEKKKATSSGSKTKEVEPNVLQAVAALFEATPLFAKKLDLMEAFETKIAGLSKLSATQIFESLKNKEILVYSRTAPRGYSLNL